MRKLITTQIVGQGHSQWFIFTKKENSISSLRMRNIMNKGVYGVIDGAREFSALPGRSAYRLSKLEQLKLPSDGELLSLRTKYQK